MRAWDEQGTPAWFSAFLPRLARLRTRLEELLSAAPGSVGLAPSVSTALTTAASSLPLPAGRRKVLIGELDFPTLGHQFLSRPDLEVEFVPSPDGATVPVGAFAERLDESVGLVATTHLYYTTGWIQDVPALARACAESGARLLVDGYQTVGCTPVDVGALGCDVFVGGCLKWLSGGPGTAFIHARPDILAQMRPRGTGWFATADPFSFTLRSIEFAADARRLETGTWPVPSHYAALAGLELVLSVGVERIRSRLLELTDRIFQHCDQAGLETVTPRERDRRCGIVTLRCGDATGAETALQAQGVVIDSRPGVVRLSPHWCVTEDEIDRAMPLVAAAVRR